MSPTKRIPSAFLNIDGRMHDEEELNRFREWPLRVFLAGWDSDFTQIEAVLNRYPRIGARIAKQEQGEKWMLDLKTVPNNDPIATSDHWVAALNGSMILLNELNAEIEFAGFLHWVGEDRLKCYFPPEQSVEVACPYMDYSQNGTEVLRPALEEVAILLQLNNLAPKVSGLMELIAYDFESWVGLYRVYEYVSAQVEDFNKQNWLDSKRLERFKQTANSFPHLGKEARHGSPKVPPPKMPMSKAEARQFVDSLCHHAVRGWLDELNRKSD